MANRELLVVGYYTPDANYRELAERMRDSVHQFGLPCIIEGRPSRAAQFRTRNLDSTMRLLLNCALCGRFVRDMQARFPDKDLLYLDADAVMKQRPALLLDSPRAYDFAAVYFTGWGNKHQLMSNTLYFAANDRARQLTEEWIALQAARDAKMLAGEYAKPYREAWDQRVLQDAIEAVPDLRHIELPWAYSKIRPAGPNNDPMRKRVKPGEEVITQEQASRENREKVT